MSPLGYYHKQTSWFWLLPVSTALILFAVGLLSAQAGAVEQALLLCGAGVLQAFVGLSFRYLVIFDAGDFLALRFGPLPVFRARIPYTSMEKVESYRLGFVSGAAPRRGWRWSLWGRDFVVISRKKGPLWLGSDDVPRLLRFLEGKIEQNPALQGTMS